VPRPAPPAAVPHRDVTDAAKAGAVFEALRNLISEQGEDYFIGDDETIAIPALDCQETTVPFGPAPSWNCRFDFQSDFLALSVDATDAPGTQGSVAALIDALVGDEGAGADL